MALLTERTTARATRRRRVAIIGAVMIGEIQRRAAVLAGAEVIGVLASTPLATPSALKTSSPTPTWPWTERAPEGLPRFVDGLRSAYVVDAVLRSAKSGSWTPLAAPTQDIPDRPSDSDDHLAGTPWLALRQSDTARLA